MATNPLDDTTPSTPSTPPVIVPPVIAAASSPTPMPETPEFPTAPLPQPPPPDETNIDPALVNQQNIPAGKAAMSNPDRSVSLVDNPTYNKERDYYTGVRRLDAAFGRANPVHTPPTAEEPQLPTFNGMAVASRGEVAEISTNFEDYKSDFLFVNGAKTLGEMGYDDEQWRRDWWKSRGFNVPEDVQNIQPEGRVDRPGYYIEEAHAERVNQNREDLIHYGTGSLGAAIEEVEELIDSNATAEDYFMRISMVTDPFIKMMLGHQGVASSGTKWRGLIDDSEWRRLRKNAASSEHFRAQIELARGRTLDSWQPDRDGTFDRRADASGPLAQHQLSSRFTKTDRSRMHPSQGNPASDYSVDLGVYAIDGLVGTIAHAFQDTVRTVPVYAGWMARGIYSTLTGDEADFDSFMEYNRDMVKDIDAMMQHDNAKLNANIGVNGRGYEWAAHSAHTAGMILADTAMTFATMGGSKVLQIAGVGSKAILPATLVRHAGTLPLSLTRNPGIFVQNSAQILGDIGYSSRAVLEATAKAAHSGGKFMYAPNTFVGRMYVEATSTSLDKRSRDRNGKPNTKDFAMAGIDGMYAGMAALVISHFLPAAGGRFKKDPASLLVGDTAAPGLGLAATRATQRMLTSGAAGGGTFLLYDAMLDSYNFATDDDKRMGIIERFSSGEMADQYIGDFFRGFMLTLPKAPGQMAKTFRQEIQRTSGYKEGADMRSFMESPEFANASKKDKIRFFNSFTEAYWEGSRLRVEAEHTLVRSGKLDMSPLTTEQLMQVVAFGDKAIPNSMLISSGLGRVDSKHYVFPTENKSGRLRVSPEAASIVFEENGSVGVSVGMARVELAKRGHGRIEFAEVEGMPNHMVNLHMSRSTFEARRDKANKSRDTLMRGERTKISIDDIVGEWIPGDAFKKGTVLDVHSEESGKTALEKFQKLSPAKTVEVYRIAAQRAILAALQNGDQAGARRIRKELKRVNDKTPESAARFIKSSWRKSKGLKDTISGAIDSVLGEASRTHTNSNRLRSALRRVVDRNGKFAAKVARAVETGRNSRENPAISRRVLDKLIGAEAAKELQDTVSNTKELRYRVGLMLRNEVRRRTNDPLAAESRRGGEGKALTVPFAERTAKERTSTVETAEQQSARIGEEGKALKMAAVDNAPIRPKMANVARRPGSGVELAARREKMVEEANKREGPSPHVHRRLGKDGMRLEVVAINEAIPITREPAVSTAGEKPSPAESSPVEPSIPEPTGRILPDPYKHESGMGVIEGASTGGQAGRLREGAARYVEVTRSPEAKEASKSYEEGSTFHVVSDATSVQTPGQIALLLSGRNSGVNVVLVHDPVAHVEGNLGSQFPSYSNFNNVLAMPVGTPHVTGVALIAEHVAQQHWATRWIEQSSLFQLTRDPLTILDPILDSTFVHVPVVYEILANKGIIKRVEGIDHAGKEEAVGELFLNAENQGHPALSTIVAKAKLTDEIITILPSDARAEIVKSHPVEMAIWFTETLKAFEEAGFIRSGKRGKDKALTGTREFADKIAEFAKGNSEPLTNKEMYYLVQAVQALAEKKADVGNNFMLLEMRNQAERASSTNTLENSESRTPVTEARAEALDRLFEAETVVRENSESPNGRSTFGVHFNGQATVSLLQRKLNITYSEAKQLIQDLVKDGVLVKNGIVSYDVIPRAEAPKTEGKPEGPPTRGQRMFEETRPLHEGSGKPESKPLRELTGDEYTARVEEVKAQISKDTPVFTLFDGKKYDKPQIEAFEEAYPGIRQEMNRQREKNKDADVLSFEYEGNLFSVGIQEVNGKRYFGSIAVQKPGMVERRGQGKEILLDAQESIVRGKAEAMVRRNLETSSSARSGEPIPEAVEEVRPIGLEPVEPGGPTGNQPPRGPGNESTGGTGVPGDTLRVIEAQTKIGGFRETIQRAVSKIFDPLTTALVGRNPNFRSAVENLINIDSLLTDQQNEAHHRLNSALAAIEKDPQGTLVKKGDYTKLAEILDTYIEPNEGYLNSHPLTKNLTATEKAVIIELKEMNEGLRQEIITELREAAQIGYRSQGSMERMATKANTEHALNVEVVKIGDRKIFRINGELIEKELFPKYMAENHVVKADWGKKYSHFPHYFRGNYKVEIQAYKQQDGKRVAIGDSEVIGQAEAMGVETSRSRALTEASTRLEELRGVHGEGVFFETKIERIDRVLPSESVYLNAGAKQALVSSLAKSTEEHRSVINAALAGRITSSATQGAFFSSLLKRGRNATGYSKDVPGVLNLMIANHYRWKKSKEIQKQISPDLNKLDGWKADYIRDLSQHTVFGSKRFEQQLRGELGPESSLVSTWESFNQNARKIQFYRQLYRPAQHIINTTQVTQLWPIIGELGFANSVKVYNSERGKQILKDWGGFGARKFEAGKFGDALGPMTNSILERTHGIVNSVTGKVWNASSEMRNQNFAFVAMFLHGKEKLGMEDAAAAKYARIYGQVWTQYRFLRANDPALIRTPGMRTLGQFKRFPVQSIGLAASILTGQVPGVAPKTAFARFMLMNMVLGGAKGSIPIAALFLAGGLAESGWNKTRQMVDDDYMPNIPKFKNDAAMYQWLNTTAGRKWADIIMFGVGAPMGLNTSGTFDLTNFGYGETWADTAANWLLGPTFGMVAKAQTEVFDRRDVNYRPALTRLIESTINSGSATRAAKSLFELIFYWDAFGDDFEKRKDSTALGIFSADSFASGTGELRYRSTLMGKFANALGFQSINDAGPALIHLNAVMMQEFYTDAVDRVAAKYRSNRLEAYRMMRLHNEAYPDFPIVPTQLSDRIRRQEDREELPRLDRTTDRINNVVERYIDKQINEFNK
jgi:hypothetical protein